MLDVSAYLDHHLMHVDRLVGVGKRRTFPFRHYNLAIGVHDAVETDIVIVEELQLINKLPGRQIAQKLWSSAPAAAHHNRITNADVTRRPVC